MVNLPQERNYIKACSLHPKAGYFALSFRNRTKFYRIGRPERDPGGVFASRVLNCNDQDVMWCSNVKCAVIRHYGGLYWYDFEKGKVTTRFNRTTTSHLCRYGDGFVAMTATGIFVFNESGELQSSYFSTVPKHSYEQKLRMPDTEITSGGNTRGNLENLVLIHSAENRFTLSDLEK